MNRFVSRIACAAALLATPGLAHAGTSTATGSASMNVLNQCSVTGANVNLGTFTTNNTWADVGSQLGYWGEAMYSYGSQGASYANFGSVTCDAGTLRARAAATLQADSSSLSTARRWLQ